MSSTLSHLKAQHVPALLFFVGRAVHVLTCMINVAKMVLRSVTTVPPPVKRLMTLMPSALAASMCMSC